MPFLVFCLLTKEAITWGSEVTSRKGMHYTYLVSSFRILVSWSPCSLGWSWDLLWTIRCKGMPDVELWGKFFFWGKIKELDEEKSFYSLFSYLEQWCEDIMFGTMTSLILWPSMRTKDSEKQKNRACVLDDTIELLLSAFNSAVSDFHLDF